MAGPGPSGGVPGGRMLKQAPPPGVLLAAGPGGGLTNA